MSNTAFHCKFCSHFIFEYNFLFCIVIVVWKRDMIRAVIMLEIRRFQDLNWLFQVQILLSLNKGEIEKRFKIYFTNKYFGCSNKIVTVTGFTETEPNFILMKQWWFFFQFLTLPASNFSSSKEFLPEKFFISPYRFL